LYDKPLIIGYALPMVTFNATIKRFNDQGEKTGWTYIEIPQAIASKLKKQKTSFAVKGKLDNYSFRQVSLLPMGDGNFIMALKAVVRKAVGKRMGFSIDVQMEVDESPFQFSEDFMYCLNDEPAAYNFFQTLPLSHQKYFSKWIESAKTKDTKAKRILLAVKALAQKKGYAEMMRWNKRVAE
jgi:hypothetical protein